MGNTTLMEDTIMQLEEQRYENHKYQAVLIIPSIGDADRLYEFTRDVKGVLLAKLVKTSGSWEENIMTLEIDKEISTEQMIEELSNMPEVATVKPIQSKGVQGINSIHVSVMLKEMVIDEPEIK